MEKKTIYTFSALPYRQKIPVYGYSFGSNDKTLAVVGSTRGDEYQQVFVCGLLVKTLQKLENKGAFEPNKGVLVIPSASQFSMNVGKRFWPMDNTDINRMFPGYNLGETTQRLASGIFEAVRGYENGIQLASFYLPGEFIPHVRYMNTGFQREDDGLAFGLPYLLVRQPLPIDTTTLNYNWQVFDTNAFSLYARATDTIDVDAARSAVAAILRFMRHKGILRQDLELPAGHTTVRVAAEELQRIITKSAGFVHLLCQAGAFVEKGDILARIFDPCTAECLEEVKAGCTGQIFFVRRGQAIAQHELIFSIKPMDQVVRV